MADDWTREMIENTDNRLEALVTVLLPLLDELLVGRRVENFRQWGLSIFSPGVTIPFSGRLNDIQSGVITKVNSNLTAVIDWDDKSRTYSADLVRVLKYLKKEEDGN